MQTFADAQILMQPATAIPKRVGAGVVISDLLGEFARPGYADMQPVLSEIAALSTNVSPISPAPTTLAVENLAFIRFYPDGTAKLGASVPSKKDGSEIAGYYIQPREAWLDCLVGTRPYNGEFTDLNWDVVVGEWETVPNQGRGAGLTSVGGELRQVIQTRGLIPENRGFRFDVSLLAKRTFFASVPEFRFTFGGNWSICIRSNETIGIERLVLSSSGANKWVRVKSFNDAPVATMNGGKYQVFVHRIAGRLVVRVNGHCVWVWDVTAPETKTKSSGVNGAQTIARKEAKVKEANWAASKWRLEVYACDVHAEVAVIKWSQPNGEPLTGTLTRSSAHATELAPEAGARSSCGGWLKRGATATVTSSANGQTITYTLNFTGGPDGIDTPFVDKAIVSYSPVWQVWNPGTIDVRAATTGLKVSLSTPPISAGSVATLELDREELDKFFAGWTAYAQTWNPVEIRVRRCGADYTRLFKGYIYQPVKHSDNTGNRTLSLSLRDPIIRLRKEGDANHAPIDHRYAPLDLLFAEKVNGGNGGYDLNGHLIGTSLYNAECVKFLLSQALGEGVASLMNGNGDPLRFLPPNHPPLISTRNDTAGWIVQDTITGEYEPLSSGKWLEPPPFGDAVFDWIMRLARRDFCVFFFAYLPEASTEWPVPVYGRLPNILASNTVQLHRLKSVALGANWERLLQSIDVEQRPEKDINRILVWAKEAEGLEGLLPSLRMAEANLPPADSRSAVRSWERTLIIREPSALLAAEAIAANTMGLLTGVDLGLPTFQIEGDERIKVGDLVTPEINGDWPDDSLGIADHWYRAEVVQHSISFLNSPGKFVTTIHPRPLTADENKAFRGAHNPS